MQRATLSLCIPTPPVLCKNPTPKPCSAVSSPSCYKSHNRASVVCKATSSYSITDIDLYELLGVHSSSDQATIKMAYRLLQKRCHPDIAGPAGHDMAIILNDAYSILSDPQSRLAYDKETAKFTELRGYAGKPIYSTWFGAESEHRALFVDEVKCVGCLKCALLAEKTFAIESVYGRARVVAQWADPEHKVQEAIDACPVDCISIVERSDLAALEFLMAKQPRGNVRVGTDNASSGRVTNIFADAKKFQTQFQDAMDKFSKNRSKETVAIISGLQAIRSISNWMYWQPFNAGRTPANLCRRLALSQGKSPQPDINKIREAASARKQAAESPGWTSKIPSIYAYDEYWVPMDLALPATTGSSSNPEWASNSSLHRAQWKRTEKYVVSGKKPKSSLAWRLPMATAAIATIMVWFHVGERATDGLKEHQGGPLALEIVNSSWLQIILAGITWYLIGVTLVELIHTFHRRDA